MVINFNVQIHWSWFKHQDLRHANVDKGPNAGKTLSL